jgi:predicted nucleic acid-binding protein
MRIALDACSCIHLASVSLLAEVLKAHKVRIPEEAVREVLRGEASGAPDAAVVRRLVETEKLNSIKPAQAHVDEVARVHAVGKGEAGAIVACLEGHADVLATDNRRARKVARALGVSLVGTPEIIVDLVRGGSVTREKGREAVAALAARQAFSQHVLEEALKEMER